jgi:hypothetical protein
VKATSDSADLEMDKNAKAPAGLRDACLAVERDIEQTALIMRCRTAAGFSSLSTRAFLAAAAALAGTWLIICSPWFGGREWIHYAEGAAMAALLGSILHFSQLRLIGEFEALRVKSVAQALELAASAAELKRNTREAVAGGRTRLVLGMGGVDFIDSSGLSALIAGLKAALDSGGALRPASLGAGGHGRGLRA